MKHESNAAFAVAALKRFVTRLKRHSSLNRFEQEKILGLTGKVESFRAGANILARNASLPSVSLVVDGIAARFDEAVDARRQITALFVPGDVCDLERLVTPRQFWGLSAFTRCMVLRIPHEQFQEMIDWYPAIRRAVWSDMAVNSAVSTKWIGNLVLKTGRSRAAHLICGLAVRMQAAGFGPPESFVLDVTQGRLAEAVGLTPIHMNRVIQSLRADELIATDGRTVRVTNWEGLREFAEFDPTYLGFPRR